MKRALFIPTLAVLSFIVGLFVAKGLQPSIPALFTYASIGIAILFVLFLLRHKQPVAKVLFIGFASLLFMILGVLRYHISQPNNISRHYLHTATENRETYQLQIREIPKPTLYQDNYIAEVLSQNQTPLVGKVLIKIDKDSLESPLKIGQEIITYASLTDLPGPLNPNQFDYAKFMANRGVYKQLHLPSSSFYKTIGQKRSLLTSAEKIRCHLEIRLDKTAFSNDEKALIKALLLGERADLSPEVYQSFINAGVVHILAISGLHIGILLGLFLFLLKPLTTWKKGKGLRVIIVIILLWCYAFITGLSPSVLRAVTMFSFLSLGLQFNRRVFTYNMLCLSALVLLMVRPHFVFEVGFQLSYCAVLSILVFYNKLYRLIIITNKPLRYFWQISCVTIAAQIGVLPLSLFYFHQFPGLFFLSNLLIIPFMGIILGSGVLTLVLISIGFYNGIIFKAFGFLLQTLLGIVKWISSQDQLRIEHVFFSKEMLALSLLCLILLGIAFHHNQKRHWIWFLTGVIGFQTFYIINFKSMSKTQHFYVYHKTAQSIFGWQKGHTLTLTSDHLKKEDSYYFLEGVLNENNLSHLEFSRDSLRDFYGIGSQNLWVIGDNISAQITPPFPVDYILLRNSPQINLDRLLKTHMPKTVIIDGSNYKSYAKKWIKTASENNIKSHYTAINGYFHLQLND